MKQFEAINKILSFAIEDSAVRAIVLKGSIARGEYDEFSDTKRVALVFRNVEGGITI
jgi:predicted nucleotidyltransferase